MIIVAMALFVAGYALSLRIGPESAYFSTVFPTIMLIGLGFAIGFPSLNIQAVSGVPDHEQGLASGLFNTSNQVGGAVVLAIVTAVISSQSVGVTAPTGVLSAYKSGLGVVTGDRGPRPGHRTDRSLRPRARRAAEEAEAAELAAVQDELRAEEMTPGRLTTTSPPRLCGYRERSAGPGLLSWSRTAVFTAVWPAPWRVRWPRPSP